MTHPDDNVVVEFIHGLLPPAERDELDAHLVTCVECRQLVAAVAAGDTTVVHDRDRMTPAPVQQHIDDLQPGAQIGRYVVLHRIGAGGMGVVYAAHDPNLNRRVAIKMLLAVDDEGQHRARLFREAQAMARLSHPNVVGVHDVGTHEGQVFLAMELVTGVTLEEWLRTPRSQREIVDVFLQAGKGLAAAHAAGLVHRDFKPSNVLVEADGRVKVTDFGLARTASSSDAVRAPPSAEYLDQPMTMTQLTRTGMVMGTPAYMSPEQLTGEQTDPRTDQFSFCVALYEALYGQRPFKGSKLTTLTEEISSGRLQPPVVSRRVPAPVRWAMLRGLAFDPNRRYHSMEALCADLVAPAWRTWSPLAAVVVVALAIGGVIGFRALGPLSPRVLHVAPIADARSAALVPSPAPAQPKPPPEPAPETPPADAPQPEPVEFAPAVVAPAPKPVSKPRPKPAVASGTGFLAVHVSPWGDVFVDDKKLDSPNMMDSVAELSAGAHRLRVTNPRFGDHVEQIIVVPSKTVDRRIDLAHP